MGILQMSAGEYTTT